jgi:hypothetical protein
VGFVVPCGYCRSKQLWLDTVAAVAVTACPNLGDSQLNNADARLQVNVAVRLPLATVGGVVNNIFEQQSDKCRVELRTMLTRSFRRNKETEARRGNSNELFRRIILAHGLVVYAIGLSFGRIHRENVS